MDRFRFDKAMGCFRFTHSFRDRVGAHHALSALRVETMEGKQERVAAKVGPKPLHVAGAAQPLESGRDRLEAPPRCDHANAQLPLPSMRWLLGGAALGRGWFLKPSHR